MPRKPVTDLSAWPSLTLEGNLISPAMVAALAAPADNEDTRQSYRIRKGLTLRDEISTAFRVGQSHFDAFLKLEHPSADATRRFVRDFLAETLGFDDMSPHEGAVCLLAGDRVPVVVTPPDEEKLDRRSPTLSTDRSRSAAFALQDYLNEREEALWGLATNGTVLRLMRDNASLTRPAYIEADLAQIFTNEDAASFAVLWLLCHRTRFGHQGAPATDCALERWRETGAKEGEAARDRLAGQVREALRLLGSGFLEANPDLAKRIQSGEIDRTVWFNELLRLVYRLIFLMVAEDRNLLHPPKAPAAARKLYAEGYSLSALRNACTRRAAWDRHHDRYEGVKIIFRALGDGEPALALPALGGLFAGDQLPHLEPARLRNRAFMEALYRLSWLTDKSGRVPVNWRAMETEELGSVYESLLGLQPQLADDGRSLAFASDATEKKGSQQKLTGSYYTPDSLVQALLDTALDPVLDKTETEASDPAEALLKLSIIDPACGSGHFLLGAARRVATRLARIRAEGTPSTEDFRHALRDVARCCIHGVDRNPMAVELAKVALWIETVDPGLPLGFFDAQIRCGDALLGIFDLKVLEDGIPDSAYKALTGDDKDTAKYYAQANKGAKKGQGEFDFGTGEAHMPDTKPLAIDFSGFRDLPEETVSQIGAKAKRFKELRGKPEFTRVRTACDLYIAAFLLPKTAEAPTDPTDRTVPTTEELWAALNQGKVREAMASAPDAARNARAFHWPLEFPDIMQRGGFDVVLGNPPWERIKLQEQEFFATRSPEIAGARNKAARDKLIKALAKAEAGSPERRLFDDFTTAKRESEATSEFARTAGKDGGRFALTGCGDVNTYALFAELFACLSRGRAGVIVPTGIATDATTAPFFAALVNERRLSKLYSFKEIRALFQATDDRNPFCLLTIGQSESEASFAFWLDTTTQLSDPERTFTLTPLQIAAINPNTLTTPTFRTKADAEIATKIYSGSTPLLLDVGPNRNPWGVFYLRLIDFGDHKDQLYSEERAIDEGFERQGITWHKKEIELLPVWEAKLTNAYDLHYATTSPDGAVLPLEKPTTPESQNFRYWVRRDLFDTLLRKYSPQNGWFLSYRDVVRGGDERTFISTAIPQEPASRKLPVLGRDRSKPGWGLLANLCCLVLDYVARLKIGGSSMGFFIVKQLPILHPVFYTAPRLGFVTPRVLELTFTTHSLAPFARDLGYNGPPFAWNEDRRALLRAELDAFYARAYGLDRDELRYILDPADVKGPDYPSETFRVLKEKEIRQHGEYRTRRLVLEAWDRMEADGTFASLDLGASTSVEEVYATLSLPQLRDLKAGSWAWPKEFEREDRLRIAAQYALWISDAEKDASRLRFLIACLADPFLLSAHLSDDERTQWQRLAGGEASPPAAGVVRLNPKTSTAWRSAFERLITSGQLQETKDGAWIRGTYFDASDLNTESSHAQRTAFALNAIRSLDEATLRTSIPAEDQFIFEKLSYGT